jgi:hypothetical protein
MNCKYRTPPRSFAAIRWTVIVLLLAQFCAAQAPTSNPSANLPDKLRVSGPIVADVRANGFQVYTLKRDAAGRLAWVLKAPDATFKNARGLEGKHYAGPTWECTTDGSKVAGKRIADSPSPAADAIPWLLVSATSHEGAGVFSTVTYIQRINTDRGKAPIVGDGKEGDEARVPYTAEYVFYGSGATTQPSTP